MKSGVNRLFAGLTCVALLAACAGPASVTRTLDNVDGASFGNILVITAAHDYSGRAMMERALVSRITAAGPSAVAYYRVVGNNSPLERGRVIEAVREGDFDAVLLTRVKDRQLNPGVRSGSPEVKATTRGGDVFNLFRYDYEELGEPETLDLSQSVVLTTELYSVATQQPVWAVETASRSESTVGELVESTADAIVGRMRRDGLLSD
jgi:hypothetical protein